MAEIAEELSRNLSLSLRPRRFSEMIGADTVLAQLKKQMESGRVPAALMLVGQPGAGKTTIARIMSIALQCDHGEFGEPCEECIANENMFSIMERNCGRYGKIDDMRELLDDLKYQPPFGKYRVFILDEAQKISADAQQCLLPPCEDETGTNVFIFCTTNPEKIIPALQRRCVPTISVPGLDRLGTARLVESALAAAGESALLTEFVPLVELLVQNQITSPGLIVKAVEGAIGGQTFEQAVFQHQMAGAIDIHALFTATVTGNWPTVSALMAKAEVGDAQMIRMRLSAFYRNALLRASAGTVRAELLTKFIYEITDHQVYETGLQLSALIAGLYSICYMATEAKKATA